MAEEDVFESAKLVKEERSKWQESHLLAPRALSDFQELSDEAFLSMRRKYYQPADLIVEMGSRRIIKIKRRRPAD